MSSYNQQHKKDWDLLNKALKLAIKAHEYQTDKAGEPYIEHVIRVMVGLDSELEEHPASLTVRTIALLHDVVRDTRLRPEPENRITHNFIRAGFGPEIADAVEALTHEKDELLTEYLDRLVQNYQAVQVKKSDLRDNTDPARFEKLNDATQKKLREKYRITEFWLERA